MPICVCETLTWRNPQLLLMKCLGLFGRGLGNSIIRALQMVSRRRAGGYLRSSYHIVEPHQHRDAPRTKYSTPPTWRLQVQMRSPRTRLFSSTSLLEVRYSSPSPRLPPLPSVFPQLTNYSCTRREIGKDPNRAIQSNSPKDSRELPPVLHWRDQRSRRSAARLQRK